MAPKILDVRLLFTPTNSGRSRRKGTFAPASGRAYLVFPDRHTLEVGRIQAPKLLFSQRRGFVVCATLHEGVRLRNDPLASSITGRVYCTPKALWKLSWFVRDFGYDTELLGRDEIDEKALVGLRGVVKISHTVMNGTSLLNLDGFAPDNQWEELSTAPANVSGSRVPS